MTLSRKLLDRSLLAGLAWMTWPVFAQAPAPGKITLRVIARDSHDQSVGDLTADDFQVSDQGKAQHITLVQHPGNRPLDTAPDVRVESGPPHTVVILFDLLNANLGYRGYGTEEVDKALQHTESNSDSIYLYLLTNSGALYPVHGLPGPDEAATRKTEGPWTRQVKPLLDAAVNQVFGLKPVDDKVPAIRVDITYRALDALSSQLARLPGRKDIIWITHGVPILVRTITAEPYDYTPRLRQLASAIDRAGITINTVDQGDAVASGSKETIEEFPAVTGGKAYSSGTLDKALPEVLSAPRATYLIEYTAPAPDGKYHKLKVSTSRKGIRLQAEQGYFANR
jgi:VWFA-related protein